MKKENNHRVQGMWMLFLRIADSNKQKECCLHPNEGWKKVLQDLSMGRYSYDYMLKEISHTRNHFGGEPVEGADVYCLRMCNSSFKQNAMTGVSLSVIKKELGDETDIDIIIPTRTQQEETLLDDIMEDEDDVYQPDIAVDNWDKRFDERFSIFFKDMYDEDVAVREK
ncbi:hypothetical protein Bca52824_011422 [Brassica carinata]|uniref:DUF287 domain-containing protein n=1 Tax=Brassica carinata TaxID=52824 RepID=A0A8X7WDG5_BRACI|nr:hypothetical protein Bca52824_011422 [Brassica carinata]